VCNEVCNGVPKLPLKNDQVASAIKRGAPAKLADGHGLYLVVRRPGKAYSPRRGPAFVAHVLRVALGILEPETIKQTLESATRACIIPRLSRRPYSRWHGLAPPGAGTVHHIAEI
jgi:hypothetical protein